MAVELADVVDVDDVRVPQPGGGLRFGLKAADQLGRSQMAGQDHLDGHRAVEPLLPGLVDHAHAAAADLADQLVRPEIARQFAPRCGAVSESPPACGRLFPRRRRQLFERFQTIQRRGQFRMFPQDRIPIRLLARLKPGEIGIQNVQGVFVERFVGHFCISVRTIAEVDGDGDEEQQELFHRELYLLPVASYHMRRSRLRPRLPDKRMLPNGSEDRPLAPQSIDGRFLLVVHRSAGQPDYSTHRPDWRDSGCGRQRRVMPTI